MEKILIKETMEGHELLCDCKCNLTVLELFEIEERQKADVRLNKLIPYVKVEKTISAYCEKCRNLYLIKSKYWASSKTDDEEIISCDVIDYYKAMILFKKLYNDAITNDSYILYVDEIFVRILERSEDNKKTVTKIGYSAVLNSEDVHDVLYPRSCFRCDNASMKLCEDEGIAKMCICSKDKQFKAFNECCDRYIGMFGNDSKEV